MNWKSLEKWLILDVRQEIHKNSLHYFALPVTSRLWRPLGSHPNGPGIIFKMNPVLNNMSTNHDNNGNMSKHIYLISWLIILKNNTKLYLLKLEHWRILVNWSIISKIVKSLASSIYLSSTELFLWVIKKQIKGNFFYWNIPAHKWRADNKAKC